MHTKVLLSKTETCTENIRDVETDIHSSCANAPRHILRPWGSPGEKQPLTEAGNVVTEVSANI